MIVSVRIGRFEMTDNVYV